MRHWLVGLLALTLATSSQAQTAGDGVAPPCDRACMPNLVDQYLAALVAHDPVGLPLGGGASNLQAGEIFKIDRGGQIVGVEAMGAQLPYGTLSGSGE